MLYIEKLREKLELEKEKTTKLRKLTCILLASGISLTTMSFSLGVVGVGVAKGKYYQPAEKKLAEIASSVEYINLVSEEISNLDIMYDSQEISKDEYIAQVKEVQSKENVLNIAKSLGKESLVEDVEVLQEKYDNKALQMAKFTMVGITAGACIAVGSAGAGIVQTCLLKRRLNKINKEIETVVDYQKKGLLVLDIEKDKIVSMPASTYFSLENKINTEQYEEDDEMDK